MGSLMVVLVSVVMTCVVIYYMSVMMVTMVMVMPTLMRMVMCFCAQLIVASEVDPENGTAV